MRFYHKKLLFIPSLLLIFIYVSCENQIIGMGPQPTYVDEYKHEPMLNVFGILRPDSFEDLPMSYVHLEYSFAYSSYPDEIVIEDAVVKIYQDNIENSLILNYTNFDSTFLKLEYRHKNLTTQAGATYHLECVKQNFPKLTAETTIPHIPVIVENSIQISDNKLSFQIQPDDLVGLYDIYLYIGDRAYSQRLRAQQTGNTLVQLEYELNLVDEGLLLVYAYDLNLAEYMTYNISIKPNTYRAGYSTVSNGFGCFGALNILKKTIKLKIDN